MIRPPIEFALAVLSREVIQGADVLEVGSLAIAPTAQAEVIKRNPRTYVGTDITPGPGVDVICPAEHLESRFGPEVFDVVFATEVVEHIRQWRAAFRNMASVLRKGGMLVVTTRSISYPYHGVPHDYWRYQRDDMERIFANWTIIKLEGDPQRPGVFVAARKPFANAELELDNIALYAIAYGRRVSDVSTKRVLAHRLGSPRRAAAWLLPDGLKPFLRRALSPLGYSPEYSGPRVGDPADSETPAAAVSVSPRSRSRASGMQGTRLLLITGLWPTVDMPSAGIFVKRRIRGVPAKVVGPRTYRGPMPWRYIRLLWSALSARGTYVGVETHVLFPAGLLGMLAAGLRGIPHVVYAHGADVRETATENWVYRSLASFVARRADAVITNSNATAGLVRALGRDPYVIPPGVDLDRFRPTPRPGQRRVLYLGGKRPEKGYDRALGVADTLAGQRLDEVDPGAVPTLIAEHDIVLMPSRAEPFGLLAAEAIASGRWVVASNVDGLREIIVDGVNGTLVDGDDFAAAVHSVPDYDPYEIARTVEKFGLRIHQERMASVWASVLTQRDRGKRPSVRR